MKEKTWFLLSLFMALKASAGISLAPGDLLFFSPLMALVNSFHVMGASRSCSSSRWSMRSSALADTCFLLLNSFSQCVRMMAMFSLSLMVFEPSSLVSDIVLGRM